MIKIDIDRPGGDIYLFDDEMTACNWAIGVARDHGYNVQWFKNPVEDQWVVIPQYSFDQFVTKKFDGWLGKGQVFS